jgi:DNA-binding CsgD family transcriptional regulator
METQNLKAVHEEKGERENEDFAEELPPDLRDAARRGLAWLEPDGLTVRKLNPAGSAWLARFFPPGMRGSRLPEPVRRALEPWRQAALRSGASGTWRTDAACGRLVVRAFADPHQRGILLTLDLLPSSARRLGFPGLTRREREVLFWVERGKTDAEIAVILQASPRTIEKHIERILAKLGVENRTAAAVAVAQSEM